MKFSTFRQVAFRKGQMTIEFAFSVAMSLIMLYSLVMVLKWAGTDLIERRIMHENKLTTGSALEQIEPFFQKPIKLDATFK